MNDKMRWRYGDTNPVVAGVSVAAPVAIGDLVMLDAGAARPPAAVADAQSEAAARKAFAAKFLGVAMQRSREGDESPIRVATTGVFEFDCGSASFELGDLVGVAGTGEGANLENQKLVKTAAADEAIGRVARREVDATTRVLVDVRSTIMTGGVAGSLAAGVAS